MKFAMPMVKDFVPKAVRPWLYVVMALCFQVSAARYLGALNEIIGGYFSPVPVSYR
jgi:MFS transporter, DHA2 family, multidrug resistance protein